MAQHEEDYIYKQWKKAVKENGQLKKKVSNLQTLLTKVCTDKGRECFCGKHGRK